MASMKSIRMLWITDPWPTLSLFNDTTLRLIQEATTMGIQTFWSASDLVLNTQSKGKLNVFPCQTPLTSSNPPNFSTGSIEMEPSAFHLIHYRVDPPVDFNYISLVDAILERDNQARIVSPPNALKHQSEKLPPPELSQYSPRLQAIYTEKEVGSAYAKFKDDAIAVIKPLNEAQSKGVKKLTLPASGEAFESLLRSETANFTMPIVIEEYLPQVDQGEVRIWFACGEVVAALKKFPKTGDFRVLIDEGSRVEAYSLSESEAEVAQAVGAVLQKQGVLLAAIDFIGGKISDYNITSPGLLVQLEEVHGGKNFARTILERLLRHLE